MTVLEARNIQKSYEGKYVLDDFSYKFSSGTRYCITGPSGIGKTTLFRLLLGLETPDYGEIILTEGLTVSPVFQENRLCENLSVLKNLKLVLPSSFPESEILSGLSALKLADSLHQPVRELSGGMKRRISLLRAVLHAGDIFLMDEPFKELDQETKEITMQYVEKHTRGKTLLWITHDLSELRFLPSQQIYIG